MGRSVETLARTQRTGTAASSDQMGSKWIGKLTDFCTSFFFRFASGETCTNEVHDGALFASLLEYLYTIQSSPDTQLELVRSVALRLVDSEEELTQQGAERFDQLANPNLKTAKKMMEWCEGRVRAALDEIDIIVTEVRKAGKNGHESKTARSQKKQAVTRSVTPARSRAANENCFRRLALSNSILTTAPFCRCLLQPGRADVHLPPSPPVQNRRGRTVAPHHSPLQGWNWNALLSRYTQALVAPGLVVWCAHWFPPRLVLCL